jgi:hypothetical protein
MKNKIAKDNEKILHSTKKNVSLAMQPKSFMLNFIP